MDPHSIDQSCRVSIMPFNQLNEPNQRSLYANYIIDLNQLVIKLSMIVIGLSIIWRMFIQFLHINNKMLKTVKVGFIFVLFLNIAINLSTEPPIWVTSDLFRAGNQNVISTLTGSDTTPTFTFIFSQELSGVPYLGYGIKAYEGNDYLGQERFEINRTDLTSTYFKVAVQIVGVTNIFRLNVPYIAIDPDFPHRIISFDNVPINYNAGALTNITSKNPTETLYYRNVVNFTQQAGGAQYNNFNTPLSGNKILFFMTTLYMQSKLESSSNPPASQTYPVDLRVQAEVLSQTEYSMMVTLRINVKIEIIKFSQIMFDREDVISTHKYDLVYTRFDIPEEGGFIPVPEEFKQNLIMGVTDFSTEKGAAIFDVVWEFGWENSKHGIIIEEINATTYKNLGNAGFNRTGFTLFYMKTWECQNTSMFFDQTTDLCTECSIENCDLCQTLDMCQQCDYVNNYYVEPTTGKCEYCGNTSNRFMNYTTQQCETCALQGCLTCISMTECSQCNESGQYFLITSPQICQLCTIANCVSCNSLTECGECDYLNDYYVESTTGQCDYCDNASNRFMNYATQQCETCALQGCLTCISMTECSQCNESGQYFLITSPQICQLCTIANCVSCNSLTECGECDYLNDYYVESTTGQCDYCDNASNRFMNYATQQCETCALQGCLTCISMTECSQCNESGQYFLITSPQICQLCTIANCVSCNSLTECGECDYLNDYYVESTTGQCDYCDNASNRFMNYATQQCETCALQGCLTCISMTECSQCNESGQYFLITSPQICQLCTIANCVSCNSLTECGECDYLNDYYVESTTGQCDYCDNASNRFMNYATQQCETCALQGCLTCISMTECSQCNESGQYFLITSPQICQLCTIANCVSCNSLTECGECDYLNDYYVEPTTGKCEYCDNTSNRFMNYTTQQCETCALQGCLTCISMTECSSCNESGQYFLITSPQICQLCTIANCISCNSLTECQTCNDTAGFCLSFDYQECEPCPSVAATALKTGCNTFYFELNLENPPNQINQQGFFPHSNISSFNAEKNGLRIGIQAEYSGDLISSATYPFYSPKANTDLQAYLLSFNFRDRSYQIKYAPSVPPIFYTEQECEAENNVTDFLLAVQIISYLIMLISAICSCKIVGLQLFGVLQLAFFSLADHSFLNIYLEPLTRFGHFNGFNTQIIEDDQSSLPQIIQKMSVERLFLNNCNVMLLVLLGELLVAGFAYILCRTVFIAPRILALSQNMLKQVFLTLIIFNAFNISFSAGISWKYGQENVVSIVIMIFALLIVVVSALSLQIFPREGYGEYIQKFKNTTPCTIYITLSIFYRIFLGIFISFHNDYEDATLIIISVSFLFNVYFTANLPFFKFYQNYRSGLTNFTMMYIIFCANYYRSMKSTTDMSVKGRIHRPVILLLVLIMLCVVVSLAVLSYQMYVFILNWSSVQTHPHYSDETKQALANQKANAESHQQIQDQYQ